MPAEAARTRGRPGCPATTWLLQLVPQLVLIMALAADTRGGAAARDIYSGPVPVNETWSGQPVALPGVIGVDYSHTLTQRPEPEPPRGSVRENEPSQTMTPEDFRRQRQEDYIKSRVQNLRNGNERTTTAAPTTHRSYPRNVQRWRRRLLGNLPWSPTDMDEIVAMAETNSSASGGDEHVLEFNVDDSGRNNRQVVNAHMFLLLKYKKRRAAKKSTPPRVKITIYNVPSLAATHEAISTESTESADDDDDGGDYQDDEVDDARHPTLITSMYVVVRHTRWHDLILPSSVIQEVLDSQSGKLQFRIDCENCDSAIEPVLVRQQDSHRSSSRRRMRTGLTKKPRPAKRRPFLIILTRPKSEPERVRRHIPREQGCPEHTHHRHNDQTAHCNVTSLYVSFADFDWVISPPGYYANTCGGSCAPPPSPSSHGHHKQCCREAQMSPLHIVYRDRDGQIAQGYLPDMAVDRCRCQ